MSTLKSSKFVVNEDGELIKAIHNRIKIPITFDNCFDSNITFEHRTITNADGSPIRLRRNGKTQTWKSRPNEFRIPVKYGLRSCLYINNSNAHEFYIVG